MILDSAWVFSDAQAMPNNTESICTNHIDWTASKWKDWLNTSQPLWIVFTCNTVPGAGTSICIEFYQHTTTTITSGDLLLTTRAVAVADLSADPFDEGHYIAAIPLLSVFYGIQNADRDRYAGPVLKGSGNVSTGKVDGWLHMGVNPPQWVAPPAVVDASNIVKPS
jgi:hypothetical protein